MRQCAAKGEGLDVAKSRLAKEVQTPLISLLSKQPKKTPN